MNTPNWTITKRCGCLVRRSDSKMLFSCAKHMDAPAPEPAGRTRKAKARKATLYAVVSITERDDETGEPLCWLNRHGWVSADSVEHNKLDRAQLRVS